MIQKTRAELEMELKSLEEKLETSEVKRKQHEDEIDSLHQQKRSVEAAIVDLNSPKNPVLKALSRLGTKAENVVRNVRLSMMDEDKLKEEFVIYQHMSARLGKKTVDFNTFKEAPEDYVITEQKESVLKKVEGEVAEGIAKTVDGISKATETIKEKSDQLSTSAKPEIDKLQDRVVQSFETVKPEIDKFQGKVAQSLETAKPLFSELNRTFKLGANVLRKKAGAVISSYQEAKLAVEQEQEAAMKTNSTPAKTPEAHAASQAQQAPTKVEETPVTKREVLEHPILSRREQFLLYMDTVVSKHGVNVNAHANYDNYVKFVSEQEGNEPAYQEKSFKSYVKEFHGALNSENSEPSSPAPVKKKVSKVSQAPVEADAPKARKPRKP